jgi:hypothetical protein
MAHVPWLHHFISLKENTLFPRNNLAQFSCAATVAYLSLLSLADVHPSPCQVTWHTALIGKERVGKAWPVR